MLDMNLREMILWAHLQPTALQNEIAAAVRKRVKTHPHEVNQPGVLGLTPCHLAVLGGDLQLIEILVLQGQGDLMQESTKKYTPLSLAKLKGLEGPLLELQQKAKHHMQEASVETVAQSRGARTLSRSSRRNTVFIERKMKDQERDIVTTPRMSAVPKLKYVLTVEDDNDVSGLTEKVSRLKISGKKRDELNEVYLVPLLKAINANRANVVSAYLQEGYWLAPLARLIDCTPLTYAFREGLSDQFALFATHGEYIRRDAPLNQLPLRHLLSMTTHSRMLMVAQNNVLEKLSWDELKKMRVEILRLSTQYNDMLSQMGLEQKMPAQGFALLSADKLKELAATKGLPLTLLTSVYQMCTCVDGTHPFDPEETANQVAGLCSQYNAFEIGAAIVVLQPLFAKAQQLMMFYALKELTVQNHRFSYQELKVLASIVLPALQLKSEDQDLVEMIRLIMVLRYKQGQNLLDNYYYLESIIQQHIPFAGLWVFRLQFNAASDDFDERVVAIADGLRAHSLMLYHNLDVRELASMGWRAPNKEQLSPSVVDIENYFNVLSNWVTQQILQQRDIKQRARLLKFCIKVIAKLVESEVPDYNSAMAIFSAINQACVTRLSGTAALLSRKTRKLREKLEETLSPHKNFLMMREALEKNPYAIPYIGIISADLTFAYENKDDFSKLMIVGKIIRQFMQRKSYLEMLHLPVTTDLGTFIAQLNIVTEKDLYDISLALEPRPFQITNEIDMNELIAGMRTIQRNEGQLKIVLHGISLEGKSTLEPLTQWLKEQYVQGKLAIGDFSEIVSLAHSIVEPDAHFKFNPAYYEHLAPREEIVVQFRRKKKGHQDSDAEEEAVVPQKMSDKLQHRK
ncbi:MAG: RasGEF domain-containing protein [Candidatus Berkiella sp.]